MAPELTLQDILSPMRFPFVPLFILALPLIEIAGFVLVGRQIGVLPTLGLVILSGIGGSILLRIQSFGAMTRIRREMDARRDPSRELAHGVMILLAGILLLIPGFFTDILGLLLFLPPIRDLGWRLIKDRVVVSGNFGFTRSRGATEKTIDLEEGEYSKAANDDSPWRRIERD